MLQTCCNEVKPITIKSPCYTSLDQQRLINILRLTNHSGLHTLKRSYNKNKNAKVVLMPPESQANNALEVENLHKSFGANHVLKGISMGAKNGEVWSIIGSSGSGKSTFLRCLNLLELPSQGHISLAGEAIEFKRDLQGHILRPTHQKQIQRLRTNMGMVFQSFNLWQHQTVLKNIIEAPIHVLGIDKAQAVDEAERLLNRVGLWDKRDAYPMHLSGGQQQRAAIARALAMQPKVMLFDEPTSALDPELVPPESQANNALEVENLHKSFGANHVLKGISMGAKNGEVWSIIGSSGSGKSTFLRCLNLLELPSQGHISLAGEAIEFKRDLQGHILRPTHQKQIQRLRTNMGMVFQSFNLWQHQTVLKNIIEAPIHVLGIDKAQAVDEAERLLNRVGLWDKRDAYPMHLSGGQQQRAAIARALAMQPKVMLFDEPTSALDPELVGEVLNVIRGIAEEGRTMIMVTHEMRFARDVSNQIIFLHEGLIEEQGSPQKIFYESESARCRAFLSSVN